MVKLRVAERIYVVGAPPDDDEAFAELRGKYTHSNPKFWKLKRAGLKRFLRGVPQEIATWRRESPDVVSFPRGAMEDVRAALRAMDAPFSVVDDRTRGDPELAGKIPPHRRVLRPYQVEHRDAAIARQNALIRSACGSGKTTTALAFAAAVNLPTLVVVHERKLLEQWVDRCSAELGVEKSWVGVIQGARRSVGPITVGMQQSLCGCAREVAPLFGCVVVDECFPAGTPVLMADGGLVPIEDVREGDVVAVGGRVVAVRARTSDAPLFRVGFGFATGGHPIATADGWRDCSSLRDDDLLWYDDAHELRRVRQADESALQAGSLQEARLERDVRRRHGEVPDVRDGGLDEGEGRSRGDGMRVEGPMEQRADGRDGREGGVVRLEAARSFETVDERRDEGEGEDRGVQDGPRGGTASEVRVGDAEASDERTFEPNDREREDSSVWREALRQWSAGNAERDRVAREDRSPGIRARSHRGPEGREPAVPLQDRRGQPAEEVGGRAGREQPQHGGADSRGLEEGRAALRHRLDRVALPGAGELRLGRAGSRGSVEHLGTVYNLQTENSVYVAAGVLVHNCHLAAARTFIEVVDNMPAKFRLGVSDDERRVDGMEFLIYDMFGRVAKESTHEELVDEGHIVDVEVRVVPTDFDFPGYRDMDDRQRFKAHDALVEALTSDEPRNAMIVAAAAEAAREGHVVIAFSERVEHSLTIDRRLNVAGVASGFVLGGDEHRVESMRSIERMRAGELRALVGTYQALGTGIDLPVVSFGVLATPIANSEKGRSRFKQFRGRFVRRSDKLPPALLYPWDHRVFGARPLRHLLRWTRGNVRVLWRGDWRPGREVLKEYEDAQESGTGGYDYRY